MRIRAADAVRRRPVASAYPSLLPTKSPQVRVELSFRSRLSTVVKKLPKPVAAPRLDTFPTVMRKRSQDLFSGHSEEQPPVSVIRDGTHKVVISHRANVAEPATSFRSGADAREQYANYERAIANDTDTARCARPSTSPS